MKERVYVVRDVERDREILVKAPNRAQAVKRVADERFTVKPATAEDVLRVTDYGGANLFTKEAQHEAA